MIRETDKPEPYARVLRKFGFTSRFSVGQPFTFKLDSPQRTSTLLSLLSTSADHEGLHEPGHVQLPGSAGTGAPTTTLRH